MNRASLLIAAGGSGTRFKESLAARRGIAQDRNLPSKVFLPLNDKPLIAHSLAVLESHPLIVETIIAVPKESLSDARKILKSAGFKNVKMIAGGKTRAESVLRAFEKSNPRHDWILVHDAARPFITPEFVDRLFVSAADCGGAIMARKVVPTIKQAAADGRIVKTVDRNVLYEAETPQLVRRELLKKAYAQNPDALQATDESSLLESIGSEVHVVTHSGWNPKITSVDDFELAEAYLKGKTVVLRRTGIGKDIHRLVPKRKFFLGGIRIPHACGALGHSDGDALLHAIADAILGAAGLGDIGEWFSDRNPKFKDIPSAKILKKIMSEINKAGWSVEHADTIIILERPRLGEYKKLIRKNLASLLETGVESVSVKAKTMEGLGPEGQGLAVSAEALVTLVKQVKS